MAVAARALLPLLVAVPPVALAHLRGRDLSEEGAQEGVLPPPLAGGNWSEGRPAAQSEGMQLFGHKYYASTTRYGDTPHTSCGGMDTRKLVEGTEYFAVASAQAMQEEFPLDLHGGGCTWQCEKADGTPVDRCEFTHPEGTLSEARPVDGCSCKQKGSCMCGRAGPNAREEPETAAMGCFTCGRGHFLRKTPYMLDDVEAHTPFGEEIKVVVADVCPYGPNHMWCPAIAGEVNTAGAKNHLDFATRPHIHYDNNFFVFTTEPCSEELMARMRSLSNCPAFTWPEN